MAMITVNRRASLTDIVSGVQSGDSFTCIENVGNKAINRQAAFADKLNHAGQTAYIEVKFTSMYSDREKRLEIVSVDGKAINIYKISKSSRYDKDAIDLDRLVDEIRSVYHDSGYEFTGTLLFPEETDIKTFGHKLSGIGLDNIKTDNY